MNGRMLSRAIHRISPTTIPAATSTATRGEIGTKRESVGPASGFTNGAGGKEATQRARVSSPPAVTDEGGLVHGAADYQTWMGVPGRSAKRPPPVSTMATTGRARSGIAVGRVAADRVRSPAALAPGLARAVEPGTPHRDGS
jgi:hypothetical protein